MREHLPGLVVNFAELRGLRIVEGGFEEFKRFGCLVLRKQIVCLVDYAVLCHTCQGESTENARETFSSWLGMFIVGY